MDYEAQQAITNAQRGRNPNRRPTKDGHIERLVAGRWKRFIDVDRGVIQKPTPAGMTVCQYIDRPGEYFTIKADPVPPDVARKAGFDVDADLQRKAIQDDQQTVRERMARVESKQEPEQVLAEAGPYRLVSVGGDKAFVTSHGERLMTEPCEEALARALYEGFAAQVEQPAVAEGGQ